MTVFVDDWRQPAQVGRLSTGWSHLTVGPRDDQLRAAEQSQAVPRAEAARELRGSRRGSATRQVERDPEMEAGE